MTNPQPPSDAFSPFVPTADEPFDHRRLSHLLRRATLGVAPDRFRACASESPGQVVDALISYDPADDRPYAELIDGLGSISPLYSPEDAQKWWLMRMLDTPRPLQERVALFWHNHFATSVGKVRQPALVSRQIDLFRRLGLGSFRDLLLGVTKDAAMLLWLDGSRNKRGRPNENYAREVMELFTLGIGHYTERDVQELARAFTGFQVLDESVEFFPFAFDDGAKNVLGHQGKFNAQSAVDLLLDQPAAPKHIARKLLKEFVHPDPQSAHVDHYARRLLFHKWQLKPVLREILTSRLFFSDYAWRSKIKSPCELVVGSILALGVQRDTAFARTAMEAMGQALLSPPSVKGWDGGEVWINANTILQRYNFALDLLTRQDVPAALARLEQRGVRTAEQVVDHYASLLLDGRLDAIARAKLVQYLSAGKPFHLAPETIENQIRGVAHLMMCTPEYQLA
jgi:uncharacterized protein (DUF1800 family)